MFFNGNDGCGTEVLWNNIGGVDHLNLLLSIVHLGIKIQMKILQYLI